MSAEQNGNSGSGPSSTQKTSFCPVCGKVCSRLQEVERHLQSHHLPYSIFCPYASCKWRGSRVDDFERHLDAQQCGPKPKEQHQYQIYNAKMVIGWIKNPQGADAISNAQNLAVSLVKERALVLGRQEWLDDPWGISEETRARRLRAT